MVWGRLRGIAHAGAEGDTNVIVSALMLEPTQLRIANIISVGPGQSNGRPREKRNPDEPVVPQVAFINEGKLVIRAWQQARRGFRSVLLGA
jgi:septum site-determining protein MinC